MLQSTPSRVHCYLGGPAERLPSIWVELQSTSGDTSARQIMDQVPFWEVRHSFLQLVCSGGADGSSDERNVRPRSQSAPPDVCGDVVRGEGSGSEEEPGGSAGVPVEELRMQGVEQRCVAGAGEILSLIHI